MQLKELWNHQWIGIVGKDDIFNISDSDCCDMMTRCHRQLMWWTVDTMAVCFNRPVVVSERSERGERYNISCPTDRCPVCWWSCNEELGCQPPAGNNTTRNTAALWSVTQTSSHPVPSSAHNTISLKDAPTSSKILLCFSNDRDNISSPQECWDTKMVLMRISA